MDSRRVWLRFGLTMVGAAIGGLGIAYLIAAIVTDKLLHPSR